MADPKLDPEIVDDLAEFLKSKSSNNKKVVAKDAIKKALTLLSSSAQCGIQKGGTGILDKCLAGVGASMIAETVYLLSKGDYDPHKVANKILTKLMITLAAHSCSIISKKCYKTYERFSHQENTNNESAPREAASIAVPNEMETMREEIKAMREEMKAMRTLLSNTRRASRRRNNNNNNNRKSAKKND